jgi:2-dehydro-3-deoxyphosphogluconate aldolase / (4S)-4-hydroxy-2-oxoglutarate aldolase
LNIDDIMRAAPVIPVLVLDGSIDPAALAEVLVEAGLSVIEVTLRTDQSLDALRRMASVKGAIVGAGTVLNERMLDQAIEAGAAFAVSPGLLDSLVIAAKDRALPYLPGVSDASHIMRGLSLELDRFKFFPAEASGGIEALSALAAPFPDARFCPTGGIKAHTAAKWLELPSVGCVGGTWIARQGETDLVAIAERARAAAALRPS